MEGDARRPFGADRILARIVAHQGDAFDALGADLAADAPRRDVAVVRLAAGHGDGVVVENLVGDGGLGRDGMADRQIARMEIGAVAQILEGVRRVGEVAGTDPGGALGAHVGKGLGVALHADGQRMAADTGQCHRTVGDFRRSVVRAAGAEVGHAGHARFIAHLPASAALQRLEALLAAFAQAGEAEAGDEDRGNLERRQLAVALEQVLAALVVLADHNRAAAGLHVEQRVLQLLLDQRALFLDHQNLALAGGEGRDALGLERPDQAHLVDGKAQALGFGIVDAELVQRLADVEIGLADGDDAEAGVGAAHHQPVEPVGAPIGERGRDLHLIDAAFLAQPVVGPADVNAVGRQMVVGRGVDFQAMRIDVDRGRGIHRLAQHLEADPEAGIARHLEGMQAPVEIFLNRCGVDHRHAGRDEGGLALVRDSGRLGHVVVAGQRHDAAVLRRAGVVGVLEDVAAAVDARALAVPHAEHAVVARAGVEMDLLGAPQRRGREVLIGAGLELDVALLDEFLGLPKRLVEAAQRRAAVAGNVARGVEARGQVALALHHGQPDQCLRAGQIHPARFENVFVVQGHRGCHGKLLDCNMGTVATECCVLQSGTRGPRKNDALRVPRRAGLARRFTVSPGNEML